MAGLLSVSVTDPKEVLDTFLGSWDVLLLKGGVGVDTVFFHFWDSLGNNFLLLLFF